MAKMAEPKPSEVSLSTFYGANTSNNGQNCVMIDEELLIDTNQLAIGAMISEGKYSVIYEGLYRSIHVAVKVIQPDMPEVVSPKLQEKFWREVSILSRVNHENIVKNRKPNMDNIPAQMAPLLQSCWAENPEYRPEFYQITEFLNNYLIQLTNSLPSLMLASIKAEREEPIATDCLTMDMRPKETKRIQRSRCLRFLLCFGQCVE